MKEEENYIFCKQKKQIYLMLNGCNNNSWIDVYSMFLKYIFSQGCIFKTFYSQWQGEKYGRGYNKITC